MQAKNLIKELQDKIPWKDFIATMEDLGFVQFSKIDPARISTEDSYRELIFSGNIMIVNSLVQSSGIKDTSLLSLTPYLIFRPISEEQLKKIVIQSQKFQIPITFASGKTGLSGGFANYGIIVDLVDLHSYKTPYEFSRDNTRILVEQGMLVSDLIKIVPLTTNQEYIFPIQPASALKLPVRIGGVISSNASGVTSGKLGAAKDWVEEVRFMKPSGEIVEINSEHSLFDGILGGNGYFGIVLGAKFRLYKPTQNFKRAILFGYNLDEAFLGLQAVLDAHIFPLVSEFVSSHMKLPGKFNELSKSKVTDENMKWAAIIKGSPLEIDKFIEIMQENVNCQSKTLDEAQFQDYLQERSAFALLVQTSDDSKDYIAFPGFEDILSQPKFLPEVIKTINSIFENKGFHKVVFGYGHINFRKGRGLLLHARLPVPLEFLYNKNKLNQKLICETVYDVIIALKSEFNIEHKAEHSPGPFRIWLDSDFRLTLQEDIINHKAFYNPNLNIVEEVLYRILNLAHTEDIFKKDLTEDIKKKLFITTMSLYIE
jgi:FAD/FMN-containing dehydrogenase